MYKVINGKKIKFAKVLSKEKAEPQHVYDLTVEGAHQYFANGHLVHNCGYHDLLTDAGNRSGEELFKLNDTFYLNRARNLRIQPIGPDRKKLRGRTNFLAGVDELGLFDSADNSNKVKMNADEVYKSLSNGLRTLNTNWHRRIEKHKDNFLLPPLLGAISSPMEVGS